MIETRTVSVRRSKYDCHEDNSMTFTNCIDEFFAEQLNCYLPWTTIPKYQNYQQCQTSNQLEQFRNLSLTITSEAMTEKITARGCFKPNCMKRTWVKNEYNENWQTQSNTTTLYINLPSGMKVIQRKEIKLAGYSVLLADFGSYLGLFLGASVLSLTELGASYLLQLQRLIENRFYNYEI